MRLAFLLSLSVLAHAQASRPLKAIYDRVTGETLFSASSPVHLRPRPECRLTHPDEVHRLEVTYRCPGDVTGCSHGNLVLTFSFCMSAWTFNTVQPSMAVDGKPIALPRALHPNRVVDAWVLDDGVAVEVPLVAVRKLSDDSKIEVNLGGYYYPLSSANMGTLRSIVERIK